MDNHSNRPHRAIRKNGIVMLCSMSLTFALLRAYLHFSPDTDLNIGRYNVHHIFTGLLLIVAGGIPLAILDASTRRLEPARWIFGAGLGWRWTSGFISSPLTVATLLIFFRFPSGAGSSLSGWRSRIQPCLCFSASAM